MLQYSIYHYNKNSYLTLQQLMTMNNVLKATISTLQAEKSQVKYPQHKILIVYTK